MLMVSAWQLLVHWKLVSKCKKMVLVFLMLGKLWLDILMLATMRLGLKLSVLSMLVAKNRSMV